MRLFLQINMRLVALILVIFACQQLAVAQQTGDKDKQPTEITSDDFPRTRDITDDIKNGKTAFVFKNNAKPNFRLKRTAPRVKHIPAVVAKTPANKTTYKLPADTKSPEGWEQIGVTFWRMVPETKSAPGDKVTARMLVQESGADNQYTPQRVAAGTFFRTGDKVRLSFETPRTGYLYVIDREIYADGKVGEPYLIFPTRSARGGDNRVQPGWVIDIPGQSDRVPFFTLQSPNPNWRGELLTVIVSPAPLSDIGMPDKPSPISPALVAALEDKYLRDASEYEQQGTEGKNYTKAEKEAGSIAKRQLTQDDPYPQTMYLVKMRPKEPMLVNLNLAVK